MRKWQLKWLHPLRQTRVAVAESVRRSLRWEPVRKRRTVEPQHPGPRHLLQGWSPERSVQPRLAARQLSFYFRFRFKILNYCAPSSLTLNLWRPSTCIAITDITHYIQHLKAGGGEGEGVRTTCKMITHTHTHARTHARTYARTHAHTRTHACMHARTHTHRHTRATASRIMSVRCQAVNRVVLCLIRVYASVHGCVMYRHRLYLHEFVR